jgi:hypothetical protein
LPHPLPFLPKTDWKRSKPISALACPLHLTVMVDGSTYLKLRDVAALTGLDVNWNEQTQTVELGTSPKNESNSHQNSLQKKNIGEGIIYYKRSEIDSKYHPTGSRVTQNGTVLWTINHKEVDLYGSNYSDHDIYYSDDRTIYNSEQFFLKYLSDSELSQFMKYKINYSTGEIAPLN